MKYEDVQALQAAARQVQHDLANMLTITDYVLLKFNTLAPERKAKYEEQWKAKCMQALQDLQQALALFNQQ